jgi:hypothetical protein
LVKKYSKKGLFLIAIKWEKGGKWKGKGNIPGKGDCRKQDFTIFGMYKIL